jgi:hypothetical protein
VERVLRSAGWYPGRTVDTARWRVELDGIDMHPFELDPSLCEGEEGRFQEWGEVIGRSLYPLGELDHGRFFLGIDDAGVIYLVETWLASFGRGDDGLIALCEGVAPSEISTGPP